MIFQTDSELLLAAIPIPIIICVLYLIIGLLFLRKFFTIEKGILQRESYFCFSLFFIFLGIGKFFAILFNFILTQFNIDLFVQHSLWFRLTIVSDLIAYGFCIFIIEKFIFQGKTKNLFTVYISIFAIYCSFFQTLNNTSDFSLMLTLQQLGIMIPTLVIGIGYLVIFFKIPGKSSKRYSLMVVIGLLLVAIFPLIFLVMGGTESAIVVDITSLNSFLVYLNHFKNITSSILIAIGMIKLHIPK